MASAPRYMLACVLAAVVGVGCAAPPATPAPAAQAVPPLQTGQTTIVMAQAAAAAPQQTLPQFLGLTGLGKAACGGANCVRNKLGKFYPGLEGKPKVLAISDPANLDSPSPATSVAADVKAQQDAAEQKIKGLRYLATIGCGGCYPDIEKALLASLDDCTEEVRYEGAQALRKAAGSPCQLCRQSSCCSPAIRKKLREIACGVDEKKCYKEPSARVRRVARLALGRCGPQPQQSGIPEEGPGREDRPAGKHSPPMEGTAMIAPLLR